MKDRTYSLRQIVLYALKLGTFGLGGPVALTRIVDWPTAVIALLSAALLLQKRKVPEPLIVGVAALIGWTVRST